MLYYLACNHNHSRYDSIHSNHDMLDIDIDNDDMSQEGEGDDAVVHDYHRDDDDNDDDEDKENVEVHTSVLTHLFNNSNNVSTPLLSRYTNNNNISNNNISNNNISNNDIINNNDEKSMNTPSQRKSIRSPKRQHTASRHSPDVNTNNHSNNNNNNNNNNSKNKNHR